MKSEELSAFSKNDLAAEYTRLTGKAPEEGKSKADIIDAIIAADAASKNGKAPEEKKVDAILTENKEEPKPEPADEAKAQVPEEKKIPGTESAPIAAASPQVTASPSQAPEVKKPEPKKSDLKLVKTDERGKVIAETTMPKAAWDNLPDHKYDWKIKPPSEIL